MQQRQSPPLVKSCIDTGKLEQCCLQMAGVCSGFHNHLPSCQNPVISSPFTSATPP